MSEEVSSVHIKDKDPFGIFYSKDDLNILTLRFIKKLDGCIKMNFRKVRVNNHKKTEEEKRSYTKS